ncbi:16S rRNA (cytosine(1402)-N(4))-methyltransferase RsmH, partial [Candidatus Curtissbacteria bacterium]|nr:16S rRNA (cytosine(1402)-N(4))-methyltransferase RsmH [Candidatus Curtissbacteria bacterium]
MGRGKLESGKEKVRGGSSVKYHESVLLQEVISYLDPKPGKKFIDATLGGGGHTAKLLENGATVLGIDRDPDAIAHVKESLLPRYLKNLEVVQGNFSQIAEIAKNHNFNMVDGILLDLGVSSHQLDTGSRGFSFNEAGPLDMRMDPNITIRAYDIVNNFEKRRLNEVFQAYGEEKFAGPIAAAICSTREVSPIETTKQLAELIEKCVARWQYKGK